MTSKNGALIKLDGVGKTFYTDEVETHALSIFIWQLRLASISPLPDPRAAGNRLCWRFWDYWIPLRMEPICSKGSR